jgi:hypothetical protein
MLIESDVDSRVGSPRQLTQRFKLLQAQQRRVRRVRGIPIRIRGDRRRSAQTEVTRLTECVSTIPPFSPFRSIL